MEEQFEIRKRLNHSKIKNGAVGKSDTEDRTINGDILLPGQDKRTLETEDTKKQDPVDRQDILLWSLGIIFIVVVVGIIFAIGHARQWDASSGYEHQQSFTSKLRFLPEPFKPEPGVRGRSDPHAASRWYYWKLPPHHVTIWTRAFPWLGYSLHQLTIWLVIYKMQTYKMVNGSIGNDKFTPNASALNWFALFANCIFTLLHFANTHTTYDALAQDVSVASSQSSVVVILIFILIMEYKDRGLFFGWPSPDDQSFISTTLRLSSLPSYFIRRYHAYAFSWAAIFTFWYHPMENTWGHVTGAVYCYLILLQGSLLYTRFHTNTYWRQFLEVWVIVHACVVATQTGGSDMLGTRLWPMFTFGFAVAFVVTQVHGLPFMTKARPLRKMLPLFILMAIVLWAYSWIPDQNGRVWVRMPEILRLPLLLYFYFTIGWFFIKLLLKVEKYIGNKEQQSNPKRHKIFLAVAMLIYVSKIALSIVTEYADVQMRMTTLTVLYDGIFLCLSCLSFLFLDMAMSFLPLGGA